MGISRSGSTVIAYAMKQQHWTLDVALAYVRERRSIVNPNDGFMKQLQTYNGILNASQQRHSTLWRRKSRDQRQKSVNKEKGGEEGKPDDDDEEEEEEEDEEDEGLDEEDEETPDEKDNSEEETEVFVEPTPKSDTDHGPGQRGPPGGNPAITINEPDKVASSVNRSGRMNLFSLMQSISELDDGDKGQLPGSPRRSPGQRRRSQVRRSLTHQSACVDVSPEPRSLQDAGQS